MSRNTAHRPRKFNGFTPRVDELVAEIKLEDTISDLKAMADNRHHHFASWERAALLRSIDLLTLMRAR
jgi:hypothetical protein